MVRENTDGDGVMRIGSKIWRYVSIEGTMMVEMNITSSDWFLAHTCWNRLEQCMKKVLNSVKVLTAWAAHSSSGLNILAVW